MPFRKRARITVTNQGSETVDAFYFNIDYQALSKDLASDTMYFHAQYRQAMPAKGWTSDWESNDTPTVSPGRISTERVITYGLKRPGKGTSWV